MMADITHAITSAWPGYALTAFIVLAVYGHRADQRWKREKQRWREEDEAKRPPPR